MVAGGTVRVLCSTTPMEGVFGPLIPLATALREQGHAVLVATAPDLVERIREVGLPAEVAGPPAALAAQRALADPAFAEGTQPWRMGAVMFARVMAPEKIPPLRELTERFAPDLMLHPSVDLAAPLVAAALGVPSLTYGTGLPLEPELLAVMARWVAPLWRRHGITPDQHGGVYRGGYLDPLPPSLRPAPPLPTPEVHPIRPYLPGDGREPLPSLLGRRPAVYVSLGTVPIFNRPEMFAPVLDGLADLNVEVVVTVGRDNDPTALGAQPDTVHVERWLSLAALLPRCAAVVCHAGAGTTLAALATGLPLVLLPRGADQFPTASAVHRAGAGLVITPGQLSPSAVGAAAHTVLTDPSFRRAAIGLRAEIQAMPSAEDVAAELATVSPSRG
jgi:UDP:flavonoid glycosyltransferase YjiC (YdhE family)